MPAPDPDWSTACTPTCTAISPPPAPTTPAATPAPRAALAALAVPSATLWRDTGAVATRMTAQVFVGRESQLAELETALADATAGRPSLVFVAGEPGLGKTRLLSELQRRVRAAGTAQVLAGDCLALGEGELPYAPLVGALRPLARSGDPVLATLPDGTRAALATLVPSLAPPTAPAVAAPAPGDPSAQARVFEALLDLIDAVTARTPVVLMIEDLHWADASTRAFLRFLSVNLCRERVLLIASFRPDELHRRHPLRPLLAELERDARAHRITLAPLTREELAEQLTDLLQATPPADLLERMYRRSEGNPLFTEELVAAGPDGRGTLPPTLRDALMVRIERLSDGAQELLRLLAVARSADHATLVASLPAAAAGRGLGEALREAVEAQILTVDGDEYRFRHALLREAVGDDLLPGERAELHLALARALDDPDAPAGGVYRATAVAHHYQAAGDQPAALEASVRAATAAEAVHAHGEAATLLERALELWDRVPDAAAVTGMREVQLLERTARAHLAGGENARVETLLRRALELVGDEDPVVSSRLLEQLARARWNQNRQADTLCTLDRSLALLPAGPSRERAWRAAGKARFLMLMGRYREAADTAHAAAELARQTGARRPEGRALNALGVSLAALGDVEAGSAALRAAEAIAHDSGSPDDLTSAAVNLSDVLHLAGRTTEAIAVAEDGLGRGVAQGRHETWLRISLAEFLIDAGRWAEAAALLAGGGRRQQGVTLLNALLRQAELALARGDDAAAGETLARARRGAEGSREPQFIAVLFALLAEHAVRDGDLTAAREVIEEGLDRIEFCTDDVHRITHLAATGVRVEADIAQRARDLGHEAEAADAARRASALLERVAAADAADGPAARPVEHAHWLTAGAEQGRAAGLAEPALWARAAAAWDHLGRPYAAARARWREAEALVLTGERERATATAADVQASAEALGAARLAAEIGALMARARLRPAGEPAAGHPGPAAQAADTAADPFGLTARERQVLALVAGGATNREVGARLYMAEKTASVHVSRILAKLDVRSRTEAAAVAHRLGLADG